MLCAWRHNMLSAPCKLTISSYLFARWHLFRHVGNLRHQQATPFDLESGVQVTCDVGYLCANFSLPGLSVFELGPMYATDVSQYHGLMPPGRGHNNNKLKASGRHNMPRPSPPSVAAEAPSRPRRSSRFPR